MLIHQGGIFWVQLQDDENAIPHPHVVIQANELNQTLTTVVACALTTNLHRVSLPGNVLLENGEANLPRQSVVEVAKVSTIAKAQLGAYIGTLSERRIAQILAGIQFIQTSFLSRETIGQRAEN